MTTEEKRPESNSCDQNRGGEDWDSEEASATLPNFTLRCTTSTPLSLMDEDVSYTPLGKMIRKPSPKKRRKNRLQVQVPRLLILLLKQMNVENLMSLARNLKIMSQKLKSEQDHLL